MSRKSEAKSRSNKPAYQLTRRGAVVPISKMTRGLYKRIISDLTVTPKTNHDYGEEAESYPVYHKVGDDLIIPRYYARKLLGKPQKRVRLTGQEVTMHFLGKLKELQKKIAADIMPTIRKKGGGVISLPCGYGKTVLALYLATKLGLKTLVVVHKTFLQNQWYERIKQFTDAEVGIIRRDHIDVEGKDIVVGMLQSISLKDYRRSIFKDFGLVIYDEVHHCASRVFSRSLYKTGCRYTLGLSATPQRKDGMTKVIHWHLGNMIVKINRPANSNVVAKVIKYKSDDPLFKEKKMWAQGKIRPAMQKMITNICEINPRNALIRDFVTALSQEDERKILILSGRLKHLDTLKKLLDEWIKERVDENKLEEGELTTAYYIGGMKEYELDESAEADIILATYDMAAEGLDIPSLNTLIFVTTKRDITQSIGRILRKQIKDGDIPPLIIDFADQLSSITYQGNSRVKYYNNNKYVVENYSAYNDKLLNEVQFLSKDMNKTVADVRKLFPELETGDDAEFPPIIDVVKVDPLEIYEHQARLEEEAAEEITEEREDVPDGFMFLDS